MDNLPNTGSNISQVTKIVSKMTESFGARTITVWKRFRKWQLKTEWEFEGTTEKPNCEYVRNRQYDGVQPIHHFYATWDRLGPG